MFSNKANAGDPVQHGPRDIVIPGLRTFEVVYLDGEGQERTATHTAHAAHENERGVLELAVYRFFLLPSGDPTSPVTQLVAAYKHWERHHEVAAPDNAIDIATFEAPLDLAL